MSIYFSTHKKKKTFPFSMFGFATLLVWTGLIVYLWQKGFSINRFLINGPTSDEKDILGFAIIVSSFLLYFLGLGISREIKSKFKFPLYIMQFSFLAISAVSGYFLSSAIFEDTIKYFMITGALYFITILIYFILQHRVYSRYYSRVVMIVTVLPVIPFIYYLIRMISGLRISLPSTNFVFDNIAFYTLLFTLLLYNAVNSFYLTYINRRVY
ncbi:MAG: hypothetical protein KAH14_03550 [Clostridiales bacterium]|nr:hypothetical protein [Clostridiales bacterium]